MFFANAQVTEHDIAVQTHRIRAGMEGSLRVGRTLRPYGEVYVRRDGAVRRRAPCWRLAAG